MFKCREFELRELTPSKQDLNKKRHIHKLLQYARNLDVKSDWDKADIKIYRNLLRNGEKTYQLTHKRTGESVIFKNARNLRGAVKAAAKDLRKSISNKRELQKAETSSKTFEFYGVKDFMFGGVFKNPGSVLNMHNKNKKNDPFEVKKPYNKNINYIGVELEFNKGPVGGSGNQRIAVANKLKKAGVGRYCNITEDPSCGHEIRVLVSERKYEEVLEKILKILSGMKFKTDERCGIHVHLDMRNRDHKRCYKNLYRMQKVMHKLVVKERRANRYCLPNKNNMSNFNDAIRNRGGGDRYYCVNALSHGKHRTLEVRLHHGTLDFKEISNWISFLLKIVNYGGTFEKDVSSPAEAARLLRYKPSEVSDLRKRYVKYNKVV